MLNETNFLYQFAQFVHVNTNTKSIKMVREQFTKLEIALFQFIRIQTKQYPA